MFFLQGTHLGAQEEKYLKNFFKGQLFHAPATIKTKVILIGISARLDFKVASVEQDEDRFVVLLGCLEGDQILLVNIYAPNDKVQHFYQQVMKRGERYEEISFPQADIVEQMLIMRD